MVEDDPEDVELTLFALAEILKPYKVVVACDGVEGLDYLLGRGAYAGRDPSVKPALILLDLNMPRIDGLGFLRQLRQKYGSEFRDIKVAIFSSSYEAQENQALIKLGVDLFILKPIGPAQSEAMVVSVKALLSGA